MSSTSRQKTKARKSREKDTVFELDNMDVLLGSENANPIERKLANTINGSIIHKDTEALTQQRENSSQEK